MSVLTESNMFRPRPDYMLGRYGIRELDIGSVIDHAIYLVRDNFRAVTLILLFTTLSVFLAQVLLLDLVYPEYFEMWSQISNPILLRNPPLEVSVIWWTTISLMAIVTFVQFPALIHAFSSAYLSGSAPSVRECMSVGLRNSFRMFGLSLLSTLAMLGGMFLCVIPGIIIMLRLYLGSECLIIEKRGVLDAMKRGFEMTKGNVLAIFMLVLTIQGAGFLTGASNLVHIRFVTAPITVLISQFLWTLLIASCVVLYYSLRCKKEHYDLELLIAKVEASARQETEVL